MSPEAGHAALTDLHVTASRLDVIRGVTAWTVVVENRSTTVGYRSLVCGTRYYDAAGMLIDEHTVEVWNVVQPGESVQTRLDG